MKTFIRLVAATKHKDTHKRRGFFGVAYDIHDNRPPARLWKVSKHHRSEIRNYINWFRENLDAPPNEIMDDYPKALCWFKDSLNDCIKKAIHLSHILREYTEIEIITTKKPGKIIWEDDHQILAIPFKDSNVS